MPEPVELLDGVVKHEDTIEIRWCFKANLSDLPPEGVTLRAPGPVPLAGNWELELTDDGVDPDIFRVRVQHGVVPVGAFGRSVVVRVQFARLVGAHERRLHGWAFQWWIAALRCVHEQPLACRLQLLHITKRTPRGCSLAGERANQHAGVFLFNHPLSQPAARRRSQSQHSGRRRDQSFTTGQQVLLITIFCLRSTQC
jgi:hypothetical protein